MDQMVDRFRTIIAKKLANRQNTSNLNQLKSLKLQDEINLIDIQK